MKTRIAETRFGLGVRPGDAPPANPEGWLLDQFKAFDPRPATVATFPTTAANAQAAVGAYRLNAPDGTRRSAGQKAEVTRAFRQYARSTLADGIRARTEMALESKAPFVERLVHFWANHFAVSTSNRRTTLLAANFEFEAIRPKVLGRFEDLLLAALRHPALLTYLDQISSMGPNSQAAVRRNSYRRQRGEPDEFGANENFAREVLELHTLGVDGGYSQKDVIELAYALTGWSISKFTSFPQPVQAPDGAFVFNPSWHEPGRRTILGTTYREGGEAQGLAVLKDLARHPSTARHVSLKLARHFVADDPPSALVDRLAARFLATGGSLPDVYAILVSAPEAWDPRPAKIRTPWDWTLASMKALGLRSAEGIDMSGLMKQLGQPVWAPGSPAGWPDVGGAFAGTNMMLARIAAARELADRFAASADAAAIAATLPGGLVSRPTRQALGASRGADRIALLLLSSEFHRR